MKWLQLLKKNHTHTINHAIYIKVFSDGTVYYLTVSTGDVINSTNNETAFPEIRRVFEEAFEIKVQAGYVLKYPQFRIFSILLVSVLIRLIT